MRPDRAGAATGAGQAAPRGWERFALALASLKFTLANILLLLVAVVFVYDKGGEAEATQALVLPLSLLSVNLLAAIATNKAFRRQLPLLVFHLALLAIIVLVALGRMTYLRATAEVLTGGEFTHLDRIEAGPWHRGGKDGIRFENLGFHIEYRPGLRREATQNRIRWRDEGGVPQTVEIGDQVPLIIRGYRFYTSPNKGFAALFRWEPAQGEAQLGSVLFPSYPLNKDDQTTHWHFRGESIAVRLVLPDRVINPESNDSFRLPERHSVTLDFPWRLANLNPGEVLPLPGGRLTYVGLTSWMGYNVFYDWTMPWLLTACTLAVLALGWHFARKFAAKPWSAGENEP